jgi:hypothetical protein
MLAHLQRRDRLQTNQHFGNSSPVQITHGVRLLGDSFKGIKYVPRIRTGKVLQQNIPDPHAAHESVSPARPLR